MEIKYKWLLDFCSYYDGKENNEPDHTSGMLCEYERVWVMRMQNWDFSLGEVNEYIHYGLGDFNADDGVPTRLKIILFNRYMHGTMAEPWRASRNGILPHTRTVWPKRN